MCINSVADQGPPVFELPVGTICFGNADPSIDRVIQVKHSVSRVEKDIRGPDTALTGLKHLWSLVPMDQIVGYIDIVAVVVPGRIQIVFPLMENDGRIAYAERAHVSGRFQAI